MFADLIEEGSWLMARIDRAEPDRKPAAKPDIRSCCGQWAPSLYLAPAISRWRFPLQEEIPRPHWPLEIP